MSRRWRAARPGAAVVVLAAAMALAATALGCGDGGPSGAAGPASFSGAPQQVVVSASGLRQLSVRWSPDPPVVGTVAAELTIRDLAGQRDGDGDSAPGAPISGLALTIVPWMPAHGHGSPVQPAVDEIAPGVYTVAPLGFVMPGQWQLRTTITGAFDDSATPAIEVR